MSYTFEHGWNLWNNQAIHSSNLGVFQPVGKIGGAPFSASRVISQRISKRKRMIWEEPSTRHELFFGRVGDVLTWINLTSTEWTNPLVMSTQVAFLATSTVSHQILCRWFFFRKFLTFTNFYWQTGSEKNCTHPTGWIPPEESMASSTQGGRFWSLVSQVVLWGPKRWHEQQNSVGPKNPVISGVPFTPFRRVK